VVRPCDLRDAALNSIYCFIRQTWPVKELIVVNSTGVALAPPNADIQEVVGLPLPYGELRNQALALATGEWIFNWLPDAWYAPEYLDTLLGKANGANVLLYGQDRRFCGYAKAALGKIRYDDHGYEHLFLGQLGTPVAVHSDRVLAHHVKSETKVRDAEAPKLTVASPKPDGSVIVNLGRIGDIINVLPVCRALFLRSGIAPKMMVCPEFAAILERVSYVEPVLFQGSLHDAESAVKEVEGTGLKATNCMFFGTSKNRKTGANFLKAQWEKLGYLEQWGKLPLVFDRRNATAETAVFDRFNPDSPYVVTCLKSHSSPPTDAEAAWVQKLLAELCREWGWSVVDISEVRLDNFADFLLLLENAKLLVCADTAILHLNRATNTPSIHFGRPKWECSGRVENVVFHCPWIELTLWENSIREAFLSVARPDLPSVPLLIHGKPRLVSICYLPPPEVGHNDVFFRNLSANPPTFPVHYVSETPDYQPQHLLAEPIRCGANTHVTGIGIFNEVIKVAEQLDAEFFMPIEPDCRVKGGAWDERLLREALAHNPDFLLAGTPVPFHTQFAGPGVRTICRLIVREYNRVTGAHIYSLRDEWLPREQWTLFPNGCFAIYRTKEVVAAWKSGIYTDKPWDMRVGLELARTYGLEYLERFSPVTQALSFNGECFIQRDYQKRRLVAGAVAGIHNIKDTWTP